MPRLGCLSCVGCTPVENARSQYSYQQGVLLTLCDIAASLADIAEDSAGADTAVTITVTSATSSQTFAIASQQRKGMTVFNNSTQILKLFYGDPATAVNFTVPIAAGATWVKNDKYNGVITGIWAVANGTATVTTF